MLTRIYIFERLTLILETSSFSRLQFTFRFYDTTIKTPPRVCSISPCPLTVCPCFFRHFGDRKFAPESLEGTQKIPKSCCEMLLNVASAIRVHPYKYSCRIRFACFSIDVAYFQTIQVDFSVHKYLFGCFHNYMFCV